MSDTRQRGMDWQIVKNERGKYNWEQVHAAILMDIRDELKQLNRVFACANFQNIPHVLGRISANTAKPKRKKATR